MKPNSIKTGGPAFPCKAYSGLMQEGMTLRDYFAAQVLSNGNSCGSPAQAAKWAYEVADAMLAARIQT